MKIIQKIEKMNTALNTSFYSKMKARIFCKDKSLRKSLFERKKPVKKYRYLNEIKFFEKQ